MSGPGRPGRAVRRGGTILGAPVRGARLFPALAPPPPVAPPKATSGALGSGCPNLPKVEQAPSYPTKSLGCHDEPGTPVKRSPSLP